jgi:hypothetical protein
MASPGTESDALEMLRMIYPDVDVDVCTDASSHGR